MSDIFLSIVTVTKDCADTISRTLDSVAEVKSDGVEYVIVDGVSTDGTLDRIHQRGDLVDRLVSEADTGIYNAMNKAVGLARGRFVLFINGDDELVAGGFPEVFDALRNEHDRIVCASTIVGDPSRPSEILVAAPKRLPFFNSVPHPSSFTPRKLLLDKPFREDLRIASDYDFFLGAYLGGTKFRILSGVTALHQRGGASADVSRSIQELVQVQREKLGLKYPIYRVIAQIYRLLKRVIK